MLGWGAIASISGAVIANGKVVVEGHRKAIQHLDGCIIARILVRDGHRVEAGDELIVLDDRELRAEISGIESQMTARSSQMRLIERECFFSNFNAVWKAFSFFGLDYFAGLSLV